MYVIKTSFCPPPSTNPYLKKRISKVYKSIYLKKKQVPVKCRYISQYGTRVSWFV